MRALSSFFLLLIWLTALPAWGDDGRIRLMYLDSEDELRAAIVLKRLKLKVPVYRLGIARSGDKQFAMVRFGVADSDRRVIGRESLRMVRKLFALLPELRQVDLQGVSEPETKEHKPDILFTASIRRVQLSRTAASLPPMAQLKNTGEVWFEHSIPEGQPPKDPLYKAARRALTTAIKRL